MFGGSTFVKSFDESCMPGLCGVCVCVCVCVCARAHARACVRAFVWRIICNICEMSISIMPVMELKEMSERGV